MALHRPHGSDAKAISVLADEARIQRVTVRIDGRPLPRIAADHIQIEQILVNVIRNAIEAVASCVNRERWVRLTASLSQPSKIILVGRRYL
jgi:two-component system sensor kinase FixL